MTTTPDPYDDLLARGTRIYPGLRIGRPARARTYWATITGLRVMRTRIKVDFGGADNVAPGAAVLVGNHLSTWDPVVAVMSTWWRITAFTKAEWFEGRTSVFFRWMGQIPLRRGDEDATEWALDIAGVALADGGKVGIYPEGTRGPDPSSLYRLHQRVLIPLLQANPDVAVHAIATTYAERPRRRRLATVRISERLPIDARSMAPDDIARVIRESLCDLGHLGYVNQYAFVVKARAERAAKAAASGGGPET
jgi:1-acyl-sn-glycerol-3-phosphate acyltransferase